MMDDRMSLKLLRGIKFFMLLRNFVRHDLELSKKQVSGLRADIKFRQSDICRLMLTGGIETSGKIGSVAACGVMFFTWKLPPVASPISIAMFWMEVRMAALALCYIGSGAGFSKRISSL